MQVYSSLTEEMNTILKQICSVSQESKNDNLQSWKKIGGKKRIVPSVKSDEDFYMFL